MTLSRQTHLRIERACLLEETRFAGRVDPMLRNAYDKAVWGSERWRGWYEKRLHRSQWQKFMDIYRRIRESQKMSNEAVQRTEASRSAQESKQSSVSAGSRR
jgi:hypothetical protein